MGVTVLWPVDETKGKECKSHIKYLYGWYMRRSNNICVAYMLNIKNKPIDDEKYLGIYYKYEKYINGIDSKDLTIWEGKVEKEGRFKNKKISIIYYQQATVATRIYYTYNEIENNDIYLKLSKIMYMSNGDIYEILGYLNQSGVIAAKAKSRPDPLLEQYPEFRDVVLAAIWRWGLGPYITFMGKINTSSERIQEDLSRKYCILDRFISLTGISWTFRYIYDLLERFTNIVNNAETIAIKLGKGRNYRSVFMEFHDGMWNIGIDIFLGVIIGSWVLFYVEQLEVFIKIFIKNILIDRPQIILKWLSEWPGGLKLNKDLCIFIRNVFNIILQIWGYPLKYVSQNSRIVILLIGAFGAGGLSLLISVFMDLVQIATIHIKLLYIMMAYVYWYQRTALAGLFRLFTGKRKNRLRKRIDCCEADMHQVVLGVTIFTVLVFTFPTTAVFYYIVTVAQLIILLFIMISEIILEVLYKFPFISVTLAIIRPKKFTSGIEFKIHGNRLYLEQTHTKISTILRKPIYPMIKIFNYYFSLSRIIDIYNGLVILSYGSTK